MDEAYILSRLSRIGATLDGLTVTESDSTGHKFASRNAIYEHYFTRKCGDEKREVKKRKKYVR